MKLLSGLDYQGPNVQVQVQYHESKRLVHFTTNYYYQNKVYTNVWISIPTIDEKGGQSNTSTHTQSTGQCEAIANLSQVG